jgi:hypothetical protein
MSTRRLIVLIALVAAVVGVQPASAVNSPNMRVNYTVLDQTSGRTHSDIAFWGNIAVSGNYDGFRVFDTKSQQLLRYFPCRGSQGDVSLWNANGRLLLFLSNDTPQTNGGTICSTVRSSDTTACGPPTCFEGIRIFDLTDPANPVHIASVYTDCGSHTHTLVPDLAHNRVLLYVSSYPSQTGPNCSYPHAKISIVGVPLDTPETASVIAQPPIDAPVGLFGIGCHDITVFMAIHKAAASCQSEGQLWDITDPANPVTTGPTVRHLDNASVYFWHSAEFTWDGQYVVFDDEGTGTCSASGNGKMWIYRVSDGQFMASYMIPRAQTTYCSVHNANVVPVLGRYLLVSAWYTGGTSVIDFTNPMSPQEVGYVDQSGGEVWSSYWYNGRIYANDMLRGQDVESIATPYVPYGQQWSHLNAQTQEDLYIPSVTALGQLRPSPTR